MQDAPRDGVTTRDDVLRGAGARSTSRLPRFKSGVIPLWRNRATVQFGLDSARALVVGDVDACAATTISMLDGTATRSEIERAGGRQGEVLLSLLEGNSLLEDAAAPLAASVRDLDADARERSAPEIAALALLYPGESVAAEVFDHRRASRVRIEGGGRVGFALAQVLTSSGVGRVDVVDGGRVAPGEPCAGGAAPEHVGLPRGAASSARALHLMPPALGVGAADLVVFAPAGSPPADPAVWADAVASGAAVLPVTTGGVRAIVGPLHAPETVAEIGCPRCVHLHRLDRDPCWPAMLEQLADRPDASTATVTTALVWAAVAAATSQILGWLDRIALAARQHASVHRAESHQPITLPSLPTAGASLELGLDEWAWQRRWWGPHPECACRSEAAHPARVAATGHD